MTTDNAKPTVITAAEFVADGYAERIAAGECVVKSLTWEVKTLERQDGVWFYVFQSSGNRHEYPYLQFDTNNPPLLEVYGTAMAGGKTATASAVDADEVARLRAEVAKYRAALALIVNAAAVYESSVRPPISDYYRGAIDGRNEAARTARAALETGEVEA